MNTAPRFLAIAAVCFALVACDDTSYNDTLNSPEPSQAQLTVNRMGSGQVKSTPAGIDCGTTCDTHVDVGTSLTLNAQPASGYKFSGWSGSKVDCASTSSCTVKLEESQALTATFSPVAANTFAWNLSIAGSGSVSTDRGDHCSADCAGQVAAGTQVTFTAVAASGYSFAGWSGSGISCSGSTCVVTVDAARSLSANFTANPLPSFALSVSVSGSGSVGSLPAGIGSCSGTCSASFAQNTVVALAATPAKGYAFTGWSGSGCSGTGACSVTMSAARSVTASFVAVPASTAALNMVVSGSGTVTSSPSGINCPSDCAETWPQGTAVTLTATPAAGQKFTGWTTGSGCSGSGTCQLTLSATASIGAVFAPISYALSVSKQGSGSVASTAAGIACGATCSASYNAGTTVTLKATPASGYTFAGWSGACSGTADCNVTVNAAVSVMATFNAVATSSSVGSSGGAMTYYLSPTGSNAADCKAPSTPCKSFATVFAKMAAGDELILLDGTYSAAAGTGSMHWNDGSFSAQIPSGTASRSTYVHALNPGRVTVAGVGQPALFLGRSTRKDSFITVQGISFEGGVALYNTSFVTLKEAGVHGALDVGTNDHDNGNTDNLVEDVWVWASQQRIIAINYRAHRNVWRRVVVRGDGCGTADCTGDGNPNVGFTVYDSHDVSVQNVIVLDRVLASSDSPYADFAIASHTGGSLYSFGHNEWLGTLSLNSPDQGYYMEPDVGTTLDPTIRISNAVAWNASSGGFNLAREGSNDVLENLSAFILGGDAIRVAPEMVGKVTGLRNVSIQGAGRFALNSAVQASYVNTTGTWSQGAYNQTTPLNATTAVSGQKYITRIEAGSVLKGTGASGADIGANVLTRYGSDGLRYGATGFDAPGSVALWPWPNEDRIKREMCAATTRGFCSTGKRLDGSSAISLTSYVWETLGSPLPAGIYP